MLSHLGPLVPGERPTELFGQRPDHPGDLVADGLGAVTRERWPVLHPWLLTAAFHWGKVQQHREPGGALHEGANRGLVEPDDQVAFPVARHRPVHDVGRPLGDHDLRGDERLAAAPRARPGHPQRAPGAQTGDELALERAAALDEQGLIDRLVRDPHGRILGEVELQPVRDLLRAPRRCPPPVRPTPVTATDNSNELNARTYAQALNNVSRSDPNADTHDYRYGMSFGGPVARNRTFFFANYEGSKLKSLGGGAQAIVPTAAMRNGEFLGE